MDKKERLVSLDALRGADMLFIMGFSGVIAILARIIGGPDCWVIPLMGHAEWVGITHLDTVFPLFLFIAGASWPFSFAAQEAQGKSRLSIVLKIFKRAALLILLGWVVNGIFDFKFSTLRFSSVLGFIGVSWMFAALLYMFVRKAWIRILVMATLAGGYWALLYFLVAPDAPAGAWSFSYEGSITGYIDRIVMGTKHIYGYGYNYKYANGWADPEGLLSIMCGTVTAMLGVFAGEIVRSERFAKGKRALLLFVTSLVLLGLGFAWMPFCPCIKKLWTPTFALFAGAYSFAALALFYWICDVMMWRKWTFFFRVIGMNSITIYVGSGIINFTNATNFFFTGFSSLFSGDWSVLVMRLGRVIVAWLFLYFLYRKNTFLKV